MSLAYFLKEKEQKAKHTTKFETKTLDDKAIASSSSSTKPLPPNELN